MKLFSLRRQKPIGPEAPPKDARYFNRLADAARASEKYMVASVFYEEVLKRSPKNAAIHIQCGHMHKEAGDLEAAGRHYATAEALTPNDPDLQLQLGHYYKRMGRLRDAIGAYKRAIVLMPEWELPQTELSALTGRMVTEKATTGLTQDAGSRKHKPEDLQPHADDRQVKSYQRRW